MATCIYSLFMMSLINLFYFHNALACDALNTEFMNISHLPDEILPVSRSRRSVSFTEFKRLQANWKFNKEEIKKMFEDYYACINENNKPENRIVNPITAVLALEGQRVELKCPICQRPDQEAPLHQMFWQRVRVEDTSTKHINPKTPGLTIADDMTLLIKVIHTHCYELPCT